MYLQINLLPYYGTLPHADKEQNIHECLYARKLSLIISPYNTMK